MSSALSMKTSFTKNSYLDLYCLTLGLCQREWDDRSIYDFNPSVSHTKRKREKSKAAQGHRVWA